jgi:hypothetical protein
MDMKEFRESLKAAIVRDRKWLKKIESILQKVSRQDPINKEIIKSLRGLKRTVLNQIRIYEKFLTQTGND